jgi:uncharacterized protein HemX
MEDKDGKLMQWEGKVGPAAIIAAIQLLIVLIGGIFVFAQVQNNTENSKLAVAELKNVVNSIQQAQSINAERVGKLETSIGFIANSVQRLEQKIDERKAK